MKSIVLSSVLMILLSSAFSQTTVPWVEESNKITPDAAYSGKTFYLKADNDGQPRLQIESEYGVPGGGWGLAQMGNFRQYLNFDKTQYYDLRLLERTPGGSYMFRGLAYVNSLNTHKQVFELGAGGNLTLGYDHNSTQTMLRVNGRAVVTNTLAIGSGTVVPAGYRLAVPDGIITEKLKVAVSGTSEWSDYVFAKDYKLMPLEEVEKFVSENKHLPNVPSALEVVENGIDVARMDAKLLEKIEELTLYLIQLKKENDALKNEVEAIKGKL